MRTFNSPFLCFSIVLFTVSFSQEIIAQNKQLTFEDVMKFEDISDPVMSANGTWVAYSVWPDRGDGYVKIRHTIVDSSYSIERGDNPRITSNGRWVGVTVKPPLSEQLKADKNKPQPGATFITTTTGQTITYDSVQTYTFSNNGNWVALRHAHKKKVKEKYAKNSNLGFSLVLKNLQAGDSYTLPFVNEFSFDSTSTHFVYSVVDTSGADNGLYVRHLSDADSSQTIISEEDGYYNNLTWNDKTGRLAFTASILDEKFEPGAASLHSWTATSGLRLLLDDSDALESWTLRSTNNLRWITDGKRLFFGFIREEMVDNDTKQADSVRDAAIYDQEQILKKRGVDVWHWDDPRIKPHEKETWQQRKNQLYTAVYHFDSKKWVQLADRTVPDIEFTHSQNYALGSSSIPYLKEMTWDGFFDDYYVVDIQNGERKQIARKLRFGAEISPSGKYVVFYEDKNWHLYDIENELYRNLTRSIDNPFYNEDHDYPYATPGYDIGGWVKGDQSVLIYDKYDIWQFPINGADPIVLTDRKGRDQQRIFRIADLNPKKSYFTPNETVLLEAYHDKKKNDGFYTADIGQVGIDRNLEEDKKFTLLTQADNSDKILYTRESYTEYPNLWVSNGIDFEQTKRISQLHLDLTQKYNWGTAELVEWNSLDAYPDAGHID
ncbi:MAG: hypothetical protein U5K69_01830 [Balneolaceae bacterium]|nr:hypothetical protein [Balneolaceae bacterium]